jgi:succinate dehydrogenase / fumarate reductase cytochrome b subunit
VLGAWAMISVIKAMGANGKEYTNIAAILSVPPAIKKTGLWFSIIISVLFAIMPIAMHLGIIK